MEFDTQARKRRAAVKHESAEKGGGPERTAKKRGNCRLVRLIKCVVVGMDVNKIRREREAPR